MSNQQIEKIQNEGEFFSPQLQKEIKDKFYYLDEDPKYGERLFLRTPVDLSD